MISLLLAAVAVCMLGLGAYAVRLRAAGPAAALVALLCAGLAYDNTAVAIGRLLGFGQALEGVNAGRFWIHALLTPLLLVAAVLIGARLGVAVLARKAVRIGAVVLALALIALGAATDIVRLALAPATYADTLRYTNTATAGPPVPAIATIVALIAVGVLLWRRAATAWLLLGAVAMFVAAAAGFRHFWLGNLGELALQATVVATLATAARTPASPPPGSRF
ncbi:hypothetical protein Cs7R123_53370 [Catellatospora sp. TT07R-123]|uniref:hypothetical protein n=1 Tax=Catellatospora sp. TT07R-123 TaxID=2733863 RepID=UPI001AFD03C1|nr:hypothetical protein [Catellatospora sp. TT07R-123]GHJ47995.1 hypothetical protein Cs7R123_53370 [Catellatospora sp. TT07R-123]